MRYLSNEERKKAEGYFDEAAKAARNSTCNRHKCGAVIVSGDTIIGSGFNSPPLNKEDQRRCSNSKEMYNKKITDKTCCVHAEQRAIMDALRNNPSKIEGSRLYFMRLDKDNNTTKAGKPYCTICSKMSLDVGIKEFTLWHENGIGIYNTDEYNTLSFEYTD
jgi:deoxycytidylate deaminase